MRALLMTLVLFPGCAWYFGGDDDVSLDPDAPVAGPADAQSAAECLPTSSRTAGCFVDLAGTVVDFATGELVVAPLTLHITTAWDYVPFFPPTICEPLTELPVSGGTFAVTDTPCDSSLHPPIVLLKIVGDGLAQMALDSSLTCPNADPADCGSLAGLELPAPTEAQATSWRAELQADGMPQADTRGLVIMQFQELDGTPAAGVAPFLREGTNDFYLVPGLEVRFLAADRTTLVRADATMTGVSGLAIMTIPEGAGFIGGARAGGDTWQPIGVLASSGWFFFERRVVSP